MEGDAQWRRAFIGKGAFIERGSSLDRTRYL